MRPPGRAGQAIIGDILQRVGRAERAWRDSLAILLGLCSGCAAAQTSGSISLVSDYRVRGISLSDNRPALQATIQYDSPSDWYAGAFMSRVVLDDADARVQVMGYGGYSSRLSSRISWEGGIAESVFPGAGRYNYADAYAGIAGDNVVARIHWSPDYLGQGASAVYAEIDGTYPLASGWRLFAHGGWQHSTAGSQHPDASRRMRDRWDVRAGIGLRVDAWSCQFALTSARRFSADRTAGIYEDDYRYRPADPRTFLFVTSYSF